MWSRTARDALGARSASVSDNDSDSDRSDASTPTSSPTRPAPNRRRTAAPAKIPASGGDVPVPASELDTAETLLVNGDLSRQCRQCANLAVAGAGHEAFKSKQDDSARSAETVGPSEPEVRPSLSTMLFLHTAAEEEEEEEEEIRSQRAAVSPGCSPTERAAAECRGFFICSRQMPSRLWEMPRKSGMCLPGRRALADDGKGTWALPFGARSFTPG